VRVLFDENLSPELVRLLADLFPQSVHVRDVGLKSADDPLVWQYAEENRLIIVSKDSDLHQRSFMFGHPPKLVWVRLGNCSTADVERLLRRRFAAITIFYKTVKQRFLRCLNKPLMQVA
jgi:predicted nuclease of predicted toxin-antitoxin system